MHDTSCGMGSFLIGMTAGVVAGTALGAAMAPSSRQIKRAAHKAAKTFNNAIDDLAQAIDL